MHDILRMMAAMEILVMPVKYKLESLVLEA